MVTSTSTFRSRCAVKSTASFRLTSVRAGRWCAPSPPTAACPSSAKTRSRATIHFPLEWAKGMEQYALQFLPERRVYTVSQLNAAIRGILDHEFPDVWVAGEISGTKL